MNQDEEDLCESNVKTTKKADGPLYLECVICGAKQEQKPFQDPDPTLETLGFLELYQKFLAVHGKCRKPPLVVRPLTKRPEQDLSRPLRDRILSITNSYEGVCVSNQCEILLRAIVNYIQIHDTGLGPINLHEMIMQAFSYVPERPNNDTGDLICKIKSTLEHNEFAVKRSISSFADAVAAQIQASMTSFM